MLKNNAPTITHKQMRAVLKAINHALDNGHDINIAFRNVVAEFAVTRVKPVTFPMPPSSLRMIANRSVRRYRG